MGAAYLIKVLTTYLIAMLCTIRLWEVREKAGV
jgi:hypothetical protein